MTDELTETEVQVYRIRTDSNEFAGSNHEYAENLNGDYIGTPTYARMLLEKFDIRPEAIPGNKVCSIGFSPRDQKWYGWSHRAIFGFAVGSRVVKGDCAYVGTTPEDLIEDHVRFFSDLGDERAIQARQECQIMKDRSGIRILPAPLKISMANSLEEALDPDTDLDSLPEVDINDGYYIQTCGRGEWTAKTLEDAKQMAVDFANGVA